MAAPPRSPEIDKYIATLAKDPKSKVFAALAEAYRKAGALDEAIHVCQDGLKYNPNYLSGIVALGRSYFEKGMKAEAREQFERVVKASPDNVIAQRILGGIYAEDGKKEAAIKAFKLILALNPKDSDALDHLDVLEGRKPPPAGSAAKPSSEASPAPGPSAPQQGKAGGPPPGLPVQASGPSPLPGAVSAPQGGGEAPMPSTEAPSISLPSSDLAGAKEGGAPPAGTVSPPQTPSTGGFEDFDEAFKDLDLGASPPSSAPSPSPVTPAPGPVAPPATAFPEAPLVERAVSFDRAREDEGGSAGKGVQIDIEADHAGTIPSQAGPVEKQELIPSLMGRGETSAGTGKSPKPGGGTGGASEITTETKSHDGVLLDEFFTASKPDVARPQPADAPSASRTEAPKASLSTSTLADLYFKQGYLDKALATYQSLLADQPGNMELTARVAAVQDAIAKKGGETHEETSPSPPSRGKAAPPSPGVGVFAGSEAIDISAEANIQRLSVWLEKIKRGG